MKGSYQLADLNITVDGNTTQLVKAQQAEREFERACETLRDVSGAEEVLIRTDHIEPKNGGPEFDQVRLRAYDFDADKHYTIDVGTTDNNPFGMYPRTDDGVKVWDWDAQEQSVIDPETGEVRDESGSNPSGDERGSATRQKHESEALYDGLSEAGRALLQKVNASEDTLAKDVTVDGTPLPDKMESFARYTERDAEYLKRMADALGVQEFQALAVGRLEDFVRMVEDEEFLQENESFEPDSELPF